MKREDIHIADLVPHAGAMVLLDEVVDYDTDRIHCRATIDPADDHPLAEQQRLPATALAEYGAQAMAVHGGLLSAPGTAPRPGRLVALRQLDLAVDGLDHAIEVDVFGQRLGGDESGNLYEFRVKHHETLLAHGKATVMFISQGDDA